MHMTQLKKYRFGFSTEGFIGFTLIMFPNIIWMICPPANNPIVGNSSDIAALNVIMSAAQWSMIALLILTKSEEYNRVNRNIHYIVICGICLALYYVSWIFYYSEVYSPLMFIGMAVGPSIYFILLALWLRNFMALPSAALFAILHIAVTISRFVK